MAVVNSAQGSITIRRLRNGDSLAISFDSNNVDTYQGIDPTSGLVSPDWTVPANQPIRTPRVTSSLQNAVVMNSHSWKRSGIALVFNGASANGWQVDSTGKFKMELLTGAIRIIDNIATIASVGLINMEWSALVTVGGSETIISKDFDIRIGNMGASSYVGAITTDTSQLTKQKDSTVLRSSLRLGADNIPNYYTKWLKDGDVFRAMSETDVASNELSNHNVSVGRADVDAKQLFICEFYTTKEGSPIPVARYGIQILDSGDPLLVVLTATTNEIDASHPAVVTAKLYKTSDMVTEYDPDGATWKMMLYNNTSFVKIRDVPDKVITVTTADTDIDGKQYDVDVIGEVSF